MLVSILVPTFNEEMNVEPLYKAIEKVFLSDLPEYDYEVVFIDNCSTDSTQNQLEDLCAKNNKAKAIFNSKNFGQFNSPYYGLCQTNGNCSILLCADFQDPVEIIPQFVHEWEKGYKIVLGIKTSSKENSFVYFLRSCYYKIIRRFSSVEQIEHFTGFGLYDRSFIKVLQELDDPIPFLRGIVAELGFKRKEIPYVQQTRRAGKTKNNLYTLFDAAMLGFTSYTKIGIRLATVIGLALSILSLVIAIVYLILKLLFWDEFPAGTAPILIGVFFIGSVQLFFIGLLGEYVGTINSRVMKRPLVIEEKRINFE